MSDTVEVEYWDGPWHGARHRVSLETAKKMLATNHLNDPKYRMTSWRWNNATHQPSRYIFTYIQPISDV